MGRDPGPGRPFTRQWANKHLRNTRTQSHRTAAGRGSSTTPSRAKVPSVRHDAASPPHGRPRPRCQFPQLVTQAQIFRQTFRRRRFTTSPQRVPNKEEERVARGALYTRRVSISCIVHKTPLGLRFYSWASSARRVPPRSPSEYGGLPGMRMPQWRYRALRAVASDQTSGNSRLPALI